MQTSRLLVTLAFDLLGRLKEEDRVKVVILPDHISCQKRLRAFLSCRWTNSEGTKKNWDEKTKKGASMGRTGNYEKCFTPFDSDAKCNINRTTETAVESVDDVNENIFLNAHIARRNT